MTAASTRDWFTHRHCGLAFPLVPLLVSSYFYDIDAALWSLRTTTTVTSVAVVPVLVHKVSAHNQRNHWTTRLRWFEAPRSIWLLDTISPRVFVYASTCHTKGGLP